MQKLKTFRPWVPSQTTFLPAFPSDWLSADHQVYFLFDLVDELSGVPGRGVTREDQPRRSRG